MTLFFSYLLIINWIYYSSVCVSVSTLCLKNDKTIHWNRLFHVENKTLPIIIDITNRTSHKIVSQILKILLIDRLKYLNVKFNVIPWLSSAENLQRLHGNEYNLPKAHINLEVWQPPGFNVEAWVNEGRVLDCGPLGPIVRRGIFALTETMDQMFLAHNKSLDHWRTFKYPLPSWNYTLLYNWLTQHRKWQPIKQYSSFDIANLPIILINREEFLKLIKELFAKVYSAQFQRVILVHYEPGSLKRTIDDWIQYASNVSHPLWRSPIFFYDWYPSTATVNRSYSRVLFPDCYGIKEDPLCDFEVNQLSKMAWVKLKPQAPLVYQLVNQFKISQTELTALLNMIVDEDNNHEIEQLACKWVNSKKHIWESWTIGWDQKQKLIIPALFSMYGKWVPGGLVNGSELELKTQNKNLFHNSSYELVLDISNLTCVEDIVLKEYLRFSTMKLNSSIILAYLAAVCSDSLESTLKVSTFQRRVVVTSSADSPKFGNISQYKYFFRTLPSMNLQMSFLLSTFRRWNWKRIVILRKDSMFYESKFFENNNIQVIEDFALDEDRLTFDKVYEFLKRIRDERHGRIFLVEYFAECSRVIMCAAYKLQMTLEHGYVWFFNPWMQRNWNNHSTANCTLDEILNSTNKYLILDHRDISLYWIGMDKDTRLKPGSNLELNLFKEFTVEAVRKIALATEKLIKEHPSALSVLDSPDVAEKFISYISNLNPNPNVPRMSDVVEGFWFLFVVEQSSKTPVCKWNILSNFSFSEAKNLVCKPITNGSNIKMIEFWGKSNDYRPPSDGSVNDNDVNCIVPGISKSLGVSCTVAIIICNVVVLVPIISIIVGCFVFFSRRLQRTQAEEGIRKPYEFLCEELAELDLPAKDVVINRTVGRGNFGIVYGGEARQDNKWVLVAIKAISKKLDFRHKYEFLSEAKLMSNLHHENIVKLIGICLNPNNDMIYLIMEHVTGGDLKKFLIKRRVKAKEDPMNEIICPKSLTNYARDIASGLLYLHQNRYLHRDVACRNCLISAEYCIKVGDFGLAKKMVKFSRKGGNGYYRFSGLGAMPIRWLPPESLQFGIYSTATDIWSYGVTLFEIVTFGVFPFGGYEHEEVVDKVKRCRFTVVNFLPESFKSFKVYEIISKCCSYNAVDRYKSMQEIIDVLNEFPDCIQPSLTDDPPNIQNTGFLFQPGVSSPESGNITHRRLISKSCKYIPELSGGHSSIPSYVNSPSDSSNKEKFIPTKNDSDFVNAFCSIESSDTVMSPQNRIHDKSQSIDYIHLAATELTESSYPNTTRNNDVESDLGYVTYKNIDFPGHVPVTQPVNETVRPNYLKMAAKSIEEHRHVDRKALPNHSCSLDLSTDTGCSDADYSIDKQSPTPLCDIGPLDCDVVNRTCNSSVV